MGRGFRVPPLDAVELREVGDLLGALESLALRLSPAPAEERLRRHFAVVQRFDCDVKATVRERETLVAYQQSVSVASRPIPEDVELPFVVHGRSSIFFATT